jgi:hypothetical protein
MSSKNLPSTEAEWLEADGLGGFASDTVSGVRTWRYHGLLVPATTPPAGRTVLVNGFEAWAEVSGETIPISSQRYSPDVIYPDGANRLVSFLFDPWPIWTFRLQGNLHIEQELFAVHGRPTGVPLFPTVLCQEGVAGDKVCQCRGIGRRRLCPLASQGYASAGTRDRLRCPDRRRPATMSPLRPLLNAHGNFRSI